jgi:hypothetical protein
MMRSGKMGGKSRRQIVTGENGGFSGWEAGGRDYDQEYS